MEEKKQIRQIIKDSILSVKLVYLNTFIKLFFRRPKYNKTYRFVICGIFKNESSFLREWIEYHEMIGVEHFYLYNNNSEDNYKDVLKPYIDRGLVTLIEWPYDQAQIKAYKNFYETYRDESQWVSFLDIDEFICPKEDVSIINWLNKHDKAPVILVYWRMFGTSNILHHDYSKLLIEQYFVSWKNYYTVGKCFVNTDYDIVKFDSSTHHETTVRYNLFGIKLNMLPSNVFGRIVKGVHHHSDNLRCDEATLQINHYWSKSWDIYDKKRKMSDVYFKNNPKQNIDYFYFHENKNISTDFTIYRFLIRLKIKMGIIEG